MYICSENNIQNTTMTYNFDETFERRGTDCMKYDCVEEACGSKDVLPMWVADMDFRTPPFVKDAIARRLQQETLGYTCRSERYYESICRWNREQHGMEVEREMVNYVPGVVCGIFLAVQCFTEKGDKILIQEPVYHPFRLVPEASGRSVVLSPLTRTDESFTMDMERLRHDIKGCRMMILCNPHNPAGICWTREQLQEVAEICAQEGVLVISDEIHCDMTIYGHRHIPFASVSETARRISITLQAPTKTFNLPGIVASQAIVYDKGLRERFFPFIQGNDMDLGNIFAFDCVSACYSTEGLEWKQQMLSYVEGNINYLISRLTKEVPQIRAIRPQASFLVFLDCRGLGFGSQQELNDFFAQKAHLGLNAGDMFGPAGTGYMRMNLGCPRSTVEKALDQLVAAVSAR